MLACSADMCAIKKTSGARAPFRSRRATAPPMESSTVPAGTEVTVQISVDETGKLTAITNTREVPDALFQAAYAAITQWRFRPYMKDQKPQYIHANVTFHVP